MVVSGIQVFSRFLPIHIDDSIVEDAVELHTQLFPFLLRTDRHFSAVESLPGIRLQTVHHIESMRDIDSCLRMIRRPKGPFPVQRNRLLGRQSAIQDK